MDKLLVVGLLSLTAWLATRSSPAPAGVVARPTGQDGGCGCSGRDR